MRLDKRLNNTSFLKKLYTSNIMPDGMLLPVSRTEELKFRLNQSTYESSLPDTRQNSDLQK